MTYTAQFLIEQRKLWLKADNEIMNNRPSGTNRNAWRIENPTDISDTIYPVASDGKNFIISIAGEPHDCWVWEDDDEKDENMLIERFDLRLDDADNRLAKYTKRASS